MKTIPMTDNPYENRNRITQMTLVMDTFGSDEDRIKSIERLKKEIELQGFHVEITVVSYT